MKYEVPNMELVELETKDVLCLSGDGFNETGEEGGNSTPANGTWP